MNTPPTPRPALPAGTYPARLSAWVDLGTHVNRWHGQATPKRQRRVLLTFTLFLPDKTSRRVSREFTLSLGERAGLRKFLESWAGRPMSAEDLADFHPLKALEKPCLLAVGQRRGTDGRLWPVLQGAMRPPAGIRVPDLRFPGRHFDLGDPSRIVFLDLPAWQQTKIRASLEWSNLTRQQHAHA